MDLLGAYGSDSDSDSDSNESNNSKGHEKITKNPKDQNTVGGEALVSKNKNLVESSKRRGRRLLQLNAILPPAIFERLTRPEDDSASESDQDDENGTQDITKKKKNFSADSNHKKNFSSLLEDLRATETTSKLTPILNDANNNNNHDSPKEEKMGMAFTLTETTINKTRNDNPKFIDIHRVPKIQSTKVENTVKNDTTNPMTMHARKNQRIKKPPSLISAAPPINIEPGNNNILAEPVKNTGHSQLNNPKQRQPTLSKREMEKALRAGKFQVLDQSSRDVVELHGEQSAAIGTTITSKEEWEQIKMTHGKVNLRGLSSYDPKAGSDTTTQDLSQKHRSKHQIHQLMASAARLEAQRSTAASNSSSAVGKTHRANAKRKYGW